MGCIWVLNALSLDKTHRIRTLVPGGSIIPLIWCCCRNRIMALDIQYCLSFAPWPLKEEKREEMLFCHGLQLTSTFFSFFFFSLFFCPVLDQYIHLFRCHSSFTWLHSYSLHNLKIPPWHDHRKLSHFTTWGGYVYLFKREFLSSTTISYLKEFD